MPSAHPECAMKILTLNTWQQYGPWEKRWKLIEEQFRVLDPDAAGFQEIFDPAWAETLGRIFTGYDVYYPEPESGLLILSRLPIKEKVSLRYGAQSEHEDKARFATGCGLESSRGTFWIFNTHLSWRPSDQSVREKQTEELARWCRLSMKDCPAALMGDFNAEADAPEIIKLTRDAGWYDPGRSLSGHLALTWMHRNPYTLDAKNMYEGEPLAERRIDFIFLRPESCFQTERDVFRVVFDQGSPEGVWPSDHFGCYVQVDYL